MSQIITAEIVRSLLRYDPETGSLSWVRSKGAAAAGTSAGTKHARGYVDVCLFGKRYGAHRLAWLHALGEWPAGEIDHINGNRADNRLANLRDVSHAVNTQNIRAPHRRNTSSGLLGVRRGKESLRFEACIRVNRRHVCIGRFDTAEQAHQAYLAAKREFHEGCTL